MKCGNCGTDLIPGNNVCPSCGALNNIDINNVNIDNINNVISSESPLQNEIQDINQSVNEVLDETMDVVNQDENFNEVENNDDLELLDELDIPKAKDESVNVAELSDDINKKEKFKLKINIKFDMKKKVTMGVCVITGTVAVIVGLLLGSILFSKNYCSVPNNVFNKDTQVVADGKNNITQVGHFVYKIPNSYMYDREANGVSVYDKNSVYKIFIKTQLGSYDNIAASKTSVKATLNEKNINVNNIKEMKVEDKKYFVVEVSIKNVNRLLVFTDASNGYVFYSEIMNNSNEYNYDVIKILNDILVNATYKKEDVSQMEKIDVIDPSLLVIKTSDTYKDSIEK